MTHIPSNIGTELQTKFGLAPDQCDTILRLICLPENGVQEWWKQYNYIEKLGDGRGFTCTIFGACSGTGDLYMVFEELAKIDPTHPLLKYKEPLKKCKGENVTGVTGLLKDLPAIGDDEKWQTAVWRVYINLYWTFASTFASKRTNRPGPVIRSALGRGFMVDTAINHGADIGSFDKIVKRMKRPDATNEDEWLVDFMTTRRDMLKSGFEHLDTSKSGDRCELWRRLLEQKNYDLKRPICAFDGYWGAGIVIQQGKVEPETGFDGWHTLHAQQLRELWQTLERKCKKLESCVLAGCSYATFTKFLFDSSS